MPRLKTSVAVNMRWCWEQEEEWRASSALEFRTAGFGWLKGMLGRVLKDKAWGGRGAHKRPDLIFKDHLFKFWVAHANKQGVILPLYSALGRSHLESPVFPGGMDTLKRVQRRASKMMEELKLLTYEERLRWLGQFSLEKRRLRKDLINVYKYFQRGCKDRTRPLSMMPRDRARGNGHKLKQRMFSQELQETDLLWGWLITDIGCPEGLWNLSFWR